MPPDRYRATLGIIPFARNRGSALTFVLLIAVGSAFGGESASTLARTAHRLADTLLANPPEDTTRAEVALAFGWMHLFGMLGEPGPGRAEEYLHMAQDAGLAEAGVVLGAMFLGQGGVQGVPRDVPKAIGYFHQAAEGGSVDAMRMLGFIYTDGEEGIPPDPAQAERYLRLAAERGSEMALQKLGPRMAEAAEWERAHPGEKADFPANPEDLVVPELAEEAKRRSGRISAVTAKIVDLLMAEASREEAAHLGDAAALALESGNQTELWNRLEQAIEVGAREIVAEQPDDASRGDAALVIGIFHYMGLLHGVDYERAREYLEMALEYGVPEAAVTLGEYHLGITREDVDGTDTAKGLKYLESAAQDDNVDALRVLGIVHSQGIGGGSPDPDKARDYFLASARHGDRESLEKLQPLFDSMTTFIEDNPGIEPPYPDGPEAVVVPELVRIAEERHAAINRMVDTVNKEMEKRILAAMRGDTDRAEDGQP